MRLLITVSKLGVTGDPQLTVAKHVNSVCRSRFFAAATAARDQIIITIRCNAIHAFIGNGLAGVCCVGEGVLHIDSI